MIDGFELYNEDGTLMAKSQTGADLVKAHVKGYTRKDGTFVKEHDDNRQAAVPPLNAHTDKLRARADELLHQGKGDWNNIKTRDGHAMHTAADALDSGDHKKAGEAINQRDTALRDEIYAHVHPAHWEAMGSPPLNMGRSLAEYQKMHGATAAKPAKSSARKPPAPGEVGHEEFKKYGAYFRPGDKVKDAYGKTHVVSEHVGPQVFVRGSSAHFHPTKLHHVDSMTKSAPAFVMVGEDGEMLAKAETGAGLVRAIALKG